MNIYHDLAVSKGFYENDERDEDGEFTSRQLREWAAVVLEEFFEYRLATDSWLIETEGSKTGKPEGRLAELVDIWIACESVAGSFNDLYDVPIDASGCRWPQMLLDLLEAAKKKHTKHFVFHLLCLREMSRLVGSGIIADEDMDNPKSFDEAIAIKHAYNETRPRKHGRGA